MNKKDKKFHNKKNKYFRSKHLNINIKKTSTKLLWKPRMRIDDAVQMTIDWYQALKQKKFISINQKSN